MICSCRASAFIRKWRNGSALNFQRLPVGISVKPSADICSSIASSRDVMISAQDLISSVRALSIILLLPFHFIAHVQHQVIVLRLACFSRTPVMTRLAVFLFCPDVMSINSTVGLWLNTYMELSITEYL